MNRKLLFSFIGLFVLLIAVGVGLVLVQKSQEIRKKAAPATTLSLSAPETVTPLTVGSQFPVSVNIDTQNQVIGAELYINFDASKLEATEVSIGDFLVGSNTIGPTIDNNAGTISYTIYLPPESTPKTGSGVLATITFLAKAEGNSTVSFASGTIIGAVGEGGQNVLSSTNPATISVVGPEESPPPSASPTASPTGSPVPQANVKFNLHLQGAGGPSKPIKVTLWRCVVGQEVCQLLDYTTPLNTSISVTPGTYDVFIKGWAHLTKKFANITITGDSTIDLSATEILAGDVNGDDIINGGDINLMIQHYFPDTPADSSADINLDGTVNGADINWVIQNYFLEGDR